MLLREFRQTVADCTRVVSEKQSTSVERRLCMVVGLLPSSSSRNKKLTEIRLVSDDNRIPPILAVLFWYTFFVFVIFNERCLLMVTVVFVVGL